MKLIIESWNKFLIEAKLMKLRVFDMDDTLLTTSSMVIVRDDSGNEIKKLTPAEYAVYDKQSGEHMDYEEFKTLKDPTPIENAMESFKRIYNKGLGEHRKLAILTARGEAAKPEIKMFLQKMNLDPNKVEVITIGDSDPLKKKEWIESQIIAGYNDIAFFDDSGKNRVAVNTLKEEYPKINLYIDEQPAPSKKIRITRTYRGLKNG
jgi:FMN phosphatase YigB (HAD superfamily)